MGSRSENSIKKVFNPVDNTNSAPPARLIVLGSTSSIFSGIKNHETFNGFYSFSRKEFLFSQKRREFTNTEHVIVLDFRCPPPKTCTKESIPHQLSSLLEDYDAIGEIIPQVQIVRCSSASVYGAKAKNFYPSELTPRNPMNYCAELLCALEDKILGMKNTTVVRLANILMRFPKIHHFQYWINLANFDETIELSDDGETVRNYCREEDVIDLISRVIKVAPPTNRPKIINQAGGQVFNTFELISHLRGGRPVIIKPTETPSRERFRVTTSIYNLR